jgi:flagellar assembly protein FliH
MQEKFRLAAWVEKPMSKIISRANSSPVETWALQTMDSDQECNVSVITAKQIEQVQQQAYQEGFTLGKKEAFAGTSQRLEALIKSLTEPLSRVDESLLHKIADLVVICAQQLIRRELRTEPDEIIAVIREALEVLPAASGKISINLHPEDAALVRDSFRQNTEEQSWAIIDDLSIARGGCKIGTENSRIDATIETRLSAVAAKMLGNERLHEPD